MEVETNDIKPGLLALKGYIDHDTLVGAVEEVRRGGYPAWQIVGDRTDNRIAAPSKWLTPIYVTLKAISLLLFLAPPCTTSESTSMMVRTIVLKDERTKHKEKVSFRIIEANDGLPLWARI